MIKLSLETLWKIGVLVLLVGITYLLYRIDYNTQSYRTYTPPIGCGGIAQPLGMPNVCMQPLQSGQSTTK